MIDNRTENGNITNAPASADAAGAGNRSFLASLVECGNTYSREVPTGYEQAGTSASASAKAKQRQGEILSSPAASDYGRAGKEKEKIDKSELK